MVQMALQEVVYNGLKTDKQIDTNGTSNLLLNYDENETDGTNQIENCDIEDDISDSILSNVSNEQNLMMAFEKEPDITEVNHSDLLMDESTNIFSQSSLLVNESPVKDKEESINDLQIVAEKPGIIEEHNCLQHPTHLSLINKLEASKNTISKLEETVKRLENILSLESEKNEKILQLERTVLQHEQEIHLCKQEHEIDQRTIVSLKKEMETKLLAMKKQYETANKEKENMVMRYAVSEKELLDCKREKDNLDKKIKDLLKENESSLLKIKTLTTDKMKLSQQLDNKNSEVSNAYKEIDKLKEEINSRDIKIKWTQNKLKSEMDAHKECSLTIDRLGSNIVTLEGEIDNCRQEIVRLNSQLEKNKLLENNLKELQAKLILKHQDSSELINANNALKSEYQALIIENSSISKQIENIEQIWFALDEKSKDICDMESENNVSDTKKEDSLMNLLKETEHILSEASNIRKSNEKMLLDISSCQAKAAELLSVSPLKLSSNNVVLPDIATDAEHKTDSAVEETDDHQGLTTQLRSRIEVLESQLAEEQESRENNMKNIARFEEILADLSKVKSINEELKSDLLVCKNREAELLAFTQKLTSTNVKLQSELSDVESKANDLEIIEKNHAATESQLKTDIEQLKKYLTEEKERRQEETRLLAREVAEKTARAENLLENVNSLQSELSLIKNKHSVQIKELQRELSQYRRKIEQLESSTTGTGSAGSTANSVTSSKSTASSMSSLNDSPIIQNMEVPAQVLVERIVKLQQESAKQNDRIEFLEEHSAQLVKELQKKSRLLQNYILREQTGTLTSNSMDRSKAELSKSGGIMASLYSSKPADDTMTFELCLEINRKLQAVLEDTLLKNITLKENIDTLGDEIARLSRQK
ncbi:hypothetical protein O3M35_006495 [Rhynocoris fuscipes]|uniref:Coiled-coil domain-containing protein 186 n=1 Tax=Rhynocoris fuscipes TaxID=488301 RepID=A0AAW1DG51_9HEMI